MNKGLYSNTKKTALFHVAIPESMQGVGWGAEKTVIEPNPLLNM